MNTIADAVIHLRRVRNSLDLSVEEVAQRSGLSRGRLANYENMTREPDLETLRAWAVALGQEVIFDVRPPASTSNEVLDQWRMSERIARLDPERLLLLEDFLSFVESGTRAPLDAAITMLASMISVCEPGEDGYTGGRRGAEMKSEPIGANLNEQDRALLRRLAELIPHVRDPLERTVMIRVLENQVEREKSMRTKTA